MRYELKQIFPSKDLAHMQQFKEITDRILFGLYPLPSYLAGVQLSIDWKRLQDCGCCSTKMTKMMKMMTLTLSLRKSTAGGLQEFYKVEAQCLLLCWTLQQKNKYLSKRWYDEIAIFKKDVKHIFIQVLPRAQGKETFKSNSEQNVQPKLMSNTQILVEGILQTS